MLYYGNKMMAEIEKPKKLDGIDEWEVKNAADTLRRAQEIKVNKKLFSAATKELRRQQKATTQALNWAAKL